MNNKKINLTLILMCLTIPIASANAMQNGIMTTTYNNSDMHHSLKNTTDNYNSKQFVNNNNNFNNSFNYNNSTQYNRNNRSNSQPNSNKGYTNYRHNLNNNNFNNQQNNLNQNIQNNNNFNNQQNNLNQYIQNNNNFNNQQNNLNQNIQKLENEIKEIYTKTKEKINNTDLLKSKSYIATVNHIYSNIDKLNNIKNYLINLQQRNEKIVNLYYKTESLEVLFLVFLGKLSCKEAIIKAQKRQNPDMKANGSRKKYLKQFFLEHAGPTNKFIKNNIIPRYNKINCINTEYTVEINNEYQNLIKNMQDLKKESNNVENLIINYDNEIKKAIEIAKTAINDATKKIKEHKYDENEILETVLRNQLTYVNNLGQICNYLTIYEKEDSEIINLKNDLENLKLILKIKIMQDYLNAKIYVAKNLLKNIKLLEEHSYDKSRKLQVQEDVKRFRKEYEEMQMMISGLEEQVQMATTTQINNNQKNTNKYSKALANEFQDLKKLNERLVFLTVKINNPNFEKNYKFPNINIWKKL